ncbi:MAG: response regulator transcription factor [Spirochaetaceae bacterium]|nr:response regulator transcription factor [Spirochaetaceae bacterium]
MRILLVDSKAPYRETIKNLLMTQADFDLVGVGVDGYDAIRLTDDLKPDVIILDTEIPLLDGLKTAASLRRRCPDAAIIIIADNMDDKTMVEAVRGGVMGLLLRGSIFEDVNSAVRNVTAGNCYMSRDLTPRAFNLFSHMVRKVNSASGDYFTAYETAKSYPRISRTELRITAFIGQGLSNRQISEILKLKEGTIRNYVSLILQKTNLKHRTQIALYALKNGFHGSEVCGKTDSSKRIEGATPNNSIAPTDL